MVGTILLLAALQAPADTITIEVATAFDRAMEISPDVIAAEFRATAASDRARQADAWSNPSLNINAENLGQQNAITGLDGFDGTEGQAVLSAGLPFGWERAGRQGSARAAASFSDASARIARADASERILGAIGAVLRDQILVESAREEASALERFAGVLALQAQEGRASEGDAARAELARGMASTRLARREAALAISATDLTRRLGYDPQSTIVLEAPVCTERFDLAPAPESQVTLPESVQANALVDAARADITLAKGLRAPDFVPQVGVRRSGGLSALYLGVSTTLPLFDRGSRRMAAANAERQAAEADAVAVEAILGARAAAARRAVEALERAGDGFTEPWFDALERTVTAAQARYDLGEGSLFELLDSRRARLDALDDYATWQAEWWQARTALARLEGQALGPEALCLDPFRRNQ